MEQQAFLDGVNSGYPVSAAHPLQVFDQKVSNAIIAYSGVTTAIGNAGGTSIIDSGLIGFGAGSFSSGMPFVVEIYPTTPSKVDAGTVASFNNLTGEVTVVSAFKGGQVPIGVSYNILVPSAPVSPVIADLAVPAQNSATNALERDVIGNKTDTPSGNSLVSGVKSLPDGIYFDSVNGIAGASDNNGTAQNPSNNPANVLTMLATRELVKVYVNGTWTQPSDIINLFLNGSIAFIGQNSDSDTFDFNGYKADGCTFNKLTLTGTCTSAAVIQARDCYLGSGFTCSVANFYHCVIYSLHLTNGGSYYFYEGCTFKSNTVNLTGGLKNIWLVINNGSGQLTVINTTDASNRFYIYGGDGLNLILNATDTAGAITVDGDVVITGKALAVAAGMTVNDNTVNNPQSAGKLEPLEKTFDLNQAAGTYNLFTGMNQAVDVEKIIIQTPTGVPGGALTGISVQTDDATPTPLLPQSAGTVALIMGSEQQTGIIYPCRIRVGKHITVTIYGGATGSSYVISITVQFRAEVNGGTLA